MHTAFHFALQAALEDATPVNIAFLRLCDVLTNPLPLQEFGRGSFEFYKNEPGMAPQYKWEEAASKKSCQV